MDDDAPDGTTLLIDVGKEFGTHSCGTHGLHCSGGGEGTRVRDRDDGDGDYRVEDRGEALDTCETNGKDEGRGFGVIARCAEEFL